MKKTLCVFVCGLAALVATPLVTANCCAVPSINQLRASVELAHRSLRDAMNRQGAAITEQLVANNQSRNRAMQQQTRALEELLKAQVLGNHALETQRLYGSGGEISVNGKKRRLSARAPSLCRAMDEADAQRAAIGIKHKTSELISEAQREHNERFDSVHDAAERLRGAARAHFSLDWLQADALSEQEIGSAVESIKSLVNPDPLPKLDASAKVKPQGKTYLAMRAALNQRYELAQQVLSRQLLQRAPIVPVGQDGQQRGSMLEKLRERVYATIEDNSEDSWLQVLERKDIAPLLRELNISLAHLYRLELERHRGDQDRAVLLAALLSEQAGQRRMAVYQEYLRAVSSDDE